MASLIMVDIVIAVGAVLLVLFVLGALGLGDWLIDLIAKERNRG